MKSMKYKIGPFESDPNGKETKIVITKLKHINNANITQSPNSPSIKKQRLNNSEEKNDDDVDSDYEDELNQVVVLNSNNVNSNCNELDDIIVLPSNNSNSNVLPVYEEDGDEEAAIVRQVGRVNSASSSESGFGTVDDENEHQNTNTPANLTSNIMNECAPLPQEQKSGLVQQQSIESSASSSDNVNAGNLSKQMLPILQPPRQLMFGLNGNGNGANNNNNSDDVINILNDNSSINSSISSTTSNRLSSCCSSIIERLVKFYYSCFCCYSTTSHQSHTPMIWSWLSIFCCCCPLLGAISLYLTHRSKMFKLKQKYDLAEKYSNYAEKLNIASLIFGVIFYAIGFFIITLVIFMYWRPHHS